MSDYNLDEVEGDLVTGVRELVGRLRSERVNRRAELEDLQSAVAVARTQSADRRHDSDCRGAFLALAQLGAVVTMVELACLAVDAVSYVPDYFRIKNDHDTILARLGLEAPPRDGP